MQPVGTPGGTGGGVMYGECLKNHAVGIGGHAVDGCGEFVETLLCGSCGCHRNYHRKESKSPTGAGDAKADAAAAIPLRQCSPTSAGDTESEAAAVPVAAIPLQSEAAAIPLQQRSPMFRKRRVAHRNKFTKEQREKMGTFAERVGWRIWRQDDTLVQQFCQEVGVNHRSLKDWMRNHRPGTLAKKP